MTSRFGCSTKRASCKVGFGWPCTQKWAIAPPVCLAGLRVWLAEHSPSFRLSMLLADGEMRASRRIFVRGLCLTGRGSFLVGILPASILEIDLKDGRLLGFHQFSNIIHESIQDIECGDCNLPPTRPS